MAIAFDSSAFNSGTTGTSHTLSHTCTGSDRILFYCALYIGGDLITGVKYNSVAMTRVDKVPGSGQGIDMWYLVNPSTGANNIVATTSSSNTLYSQSASYTGASQTGQLNATNKVGYTAPVSSQYTSVTTNVDNCWLVGCLNSGTTSMFAGTGTTFRAGVNNSIQIADSNGPKSPTGSYSLGVTLSTASTAQIVAAFSPAGATPTTNSNFFLFF